MFETIAGCHKASPVEGYHLEEGYMGEGGQQAVSYWLAGSRVSRTTFILAVVVQPLTRVQIHRL